MSAQTVCDQCKKRKKSCTKTFPSCERCSRFGVNCTYTPVLPRHGAFRTKSVVLEDVIPAFARNCTPVTGENSVVGIYSPGFSLEEQISVQVQRLLDSISRKRGPIEGFVEVYFKDFQRSLPIIDRDSFYERLETYSLLSRTRSSDAQFGVLILVVVLVAGLSASVSGNGEGSGDGSGDRDATELYETVRNLYGLLQGSGRASVELVQAGVGIAAWEHAMGLGREAWLRIGGAARMGGVLGLHLAIRTSTRGNEEEKRDLELKRSLWWGVVVLERVISLDYEHHKLPFATQAPCLDDILPIVPGESASTHPVSTELITPDMTAYEASELFNREFTRLGNFGSTVQATYLSSLLTRHIGTEYKSHAAREAEARKLEAALHSFGCTLIPPPGMSVGLYCGAYSIRTLELWALHLHSLSCATDAGDKEGVSRATIALQSHTRTLIYMTKAADVGKPLDLDTLAFWSHAICSKAALVHIQFGERNAEWQGDLDVLKGYLRNFIGRYGIYERHLREIEAAEKAAKSVDANLSSLSTISGGTAMES